MTLNLYADPALAGTYSQFGTAAVQSGNSFQFNNCINDSLYIGSGSPLLADIMDRIAESGKYHVSVHVANYVEGDGRVKMAGSANTLLGITGDGWSTPVPVVAGVSRTQGITFFGYSLAPATFDIVPDVNGEAVRITT